MLSIIIDFHLLDGSQFSLQMLHPVTLKYADLHFLFHPQGVALYQLEGFEAPDVE